MAVLTGYDGSARLVEVDEIDGVLVERASAVEVDLIDLVAVFGLPDLPAD